MQHQFCSSVMTGRGATAVRSDDPETFSVRSISLGREFARYSPVKRIVQEFKYGWLAFRATTSFRPDAAVFANVPVIPLAVISIGLKMRKIPFVFWWQDVYSEAAGAIAKRRLGRLGGLAAWLFNLIERGIASRAAEIVPITEAFTDRLNEWGIDPAKVSVIPNWGALDEVSPKPRLNPWSQSHGLDDVKVVMYAGTLGLKHDPSLIAELLHSVPDNCRMVVVTQGKGREWLEDHCADNAKLILLDFQPYEDLPDMLGSADLLLALLEQDASRYSVPSKVLTYLCSGRPILALLPRENSVARVVVAAEAGVVASPSDRIGAAVALNELLSDDELRARLAANGRSYAEAAFDIESITDKFVSVLARACARQSSRSIGRAS